MIEIHGKRECPFAWRVRLCAKEKNLPFHWIPFDVRDPDPASAQHNPEKHSPLLWDDGFSLTESEVILHYLDEAHPGSHLQPLSARDRAQMLLRMVQLRKLEAHPPEHPGNPKKLEAGFDSLEKALRDGRLLLGGSKPDLSDISVWPFLWVLTHAGIQPPGAHTKMYWNRIRERDSLVATRPTDR